MKWCERKNCVFAYALASMLIIVLFSTESSVFISTVVSKAIRGFPLEEEIIKMPHSLNPSPSPSRSPTSLRTTASPSSPPSPRPTPSPSRRPTFTPSARPTLSPTRQMTRQPTPAPSPRPTFTPSNPPTQPKKLIDETVKDVYYRKMWDYNATRSMDHQKKFLARRHQVFEQFDKVDRYQPIVDRYAAVSLTEKFAFLHIWKCGGTTVCQMTPNSQTTLQAPEIQRREWFGLVRDPIDRFLSAWAECGMRHYESQGSHTEMEKHSVLNDLDSEYDFRVRSWLHEVKGFLNECTCHTHAVPQGNFMMNPAGLVDEHITFVADLADLRKSLNIAGLNFKDDDIVIGRDASKNDIKTSYYPSDRNLLSEQTILELCEFYAIDYFLFDFEPPTVCVGDVGPLQKYLRGWGKSQ